MSGNTNYKFTGWGPPTNDEDKEYLGKKALSVSKANFEVHVKNNPLVKVVPTTVNYYVAERTSEILRLKYMSTTKQVPYCDCFGVEFEW